MFSIGNKALTIITCAVIFSGFFYFGIYFFSPRIISNWQKYLVVNVKEYRPILEKYNRFNIQILADGKPISQNNNDTDDWVEPYIRDYSGKEDLRISWPKITEYLETLAPHLNIEPVNAKIKYDGNRASVFVPSNEGRELNITRSVGLISATLIEGLPSVSLDLEIIEPEVTLEKINNLGINTLLGRGESDYGKSPSSRIHNIKVGMAKFNGIILKPGEEFSFNNFLGAIEEKDGYQAELVIKGGQLVREYGGGLCQISTTVFRAAILSGLPITERKPHSFPVQYYNPQGFDSTIYPGVVDLKFVNDTSNHILIQTRVIGSRLVVEIYGSDDGREVKMDGPLQYDRKANGAMKAYFVRKIYRDGQLAKEERFDSTYKSPPLSPLERNPLE